MAYPGHSSVRELQIFDALHLVRITFLLLILHIFVLYILQSVHNKCPIFWGDGGGSDLRMAYPGHSSVGVLKIFDALHLVRITFLVLFLPILCFMY